MDVLYKNDKKEDLSLTLTTKDAIAIFHIFDKFTQFEESCKNYVNSSKFDLRALSKAINGKYTFNKGAKQFYYENKETIEIIKNQTSFTNYIIKNYLHDKSRTNIRRFYNYLKNNINSLDNVLSILNRLKELRIEEFTLDENRNFDNEVYSFEMGPKTSFIRTYLDGEITILPSYSFNTVEYTAKNANYSINIDLSLDRLGFYTGKIILNNLTFDVKNLPPILSFEETIGKISNLKSQNALKDYFIRNTADITYTVNEINCLLRRIDEVINKLDIDNDQAKALNLISKTKESVKTFQDFLIEYENKKKHEYDISDELLEQEKKLYKKYLESLKYDYD